MELLFSQFTPFTPETIVHLIGYAVCVVLALLATYTLLGVRYIPNRAVGIVEINPVDPMMMNPDEEGNACVHRYAWIVVLVIIGVGQGHHRATAVQIAQFFA